LNNLRKIAGLSIALRISGNQILTWENWTFSNTLFYLVPRLLGAVSSRFGIQKINDQGALQSRGDSVYFIVRPLIIEDCISARRIQGERFHATFSNHTLPFAAILSLVNLKMAQIGVF
jgi:hypothetical protein